MKKKLFLLLTSFLVVINMYPQYKNCEIKIDNWTYLVVDESYSGNPYASNNEVYVVKLWLDQNVKDVIIPETVKYDANGFTYHVVGIEDKAFANKSWIESISIHKKIRKIGWNVFEGCTSLSKIYYDATTLNSVSDGRNSAFYSVSEQITFFEIGEHTEEIPEFLCYCMNNVKTIIIPQNVHYIGENAFMGSGIETIVWNAQTCEDEVWYDGRSIDSSKTPFWNLRQYITSISFGDKVKELPAGLFYNLDNITEFTLPSSLKTIGPMTFSNMEKLTFVTCEATEPPSCKSSSFSMMDIKNITLYVPSESIEKYKSAYVWKDFGRIIPIGGTNVMDTPIKQKTKKVIHNGQLLIIHEGKTYNMIGNEIKAK